MADYPRKLDGARANPACQRFGLSKHVGEEHLVMSPERIERPAERDEVAWNESRALMNQLVERMLAVGAGLAPVDRADIVVDSAAIELDVFAVALHRQLLEISGKSLEILFVR
jgi:hypothetical protein